MTEITDEMVEDAAKAIYECDVRPGDWVWSLARTPERLHRGRAALEAAYSVDAPRPLLDREAVWRGVYSAAIQHLNPSGVADKAADAVMESARPMLTREQVDAFLQEWRVRPPGEPTQQEAVNYRRKMRNALLALIGGGE